MRSNPIPVIAALLLLPFTLAAQDDARYNLLLKSGTITPSPNISAEKINEFDRKALKVAGRAFLVLQFEKIPTEQEKQELKLQGIELLDYIPHNAYTAIVSVLPDATVLTTYKIRAFLELSPQQKMQPELAAGNFPARAEKVYGTVDVRVSFPRSFSFDEIIKELQNRGFDIGNTKYKYYHIISLRVAKQRLQELASLPFIDYVEAAPGADIPLSQFWTQWGRDGQRASLLNAPLSQGGKNLKGSGVAIGIGDDSDPQQHVDFSGRLISRAAAVYDFHGTHVTGIAGGAGIRNELRTGFAPKSTLISQSFANIISNAPAYVTDYGMVITNNSYGNVINECATFGVYDLYSRVLDQQAYDLPNMQNVFAAGNSGYFSCPPMPDSFRTVLGGYQSAKNVLSVGNARPTGTIYQQSSRGPVRDGRIKPEIVGIGAFIESTAPPPFDYYWENTGTSMASPAIAGGMALLYENYRALHPPGLNPKNGLMKALVCNSGDDWGNPGPDYTHGFGVANFWRANEMLENNHYATGSIAPLDPPQTVTVSVPSGLAQLKVMLYWNDPPAAAVAGLTLVNDLDLEVVTPAAAVILPTITDTAFTQIKNNAHTGADHVNNIEQVLISNPATGNYTIRVKATNITVNPSQEYFIVYDFVPVETKLTTPVGGEAYLHGENMIIQWDSYGDPANTFTLEFSSNNGANWSTLKNNIAANKRHYFYSNPDPNEWFIVPNNVSTDQALMRITRNGTALTHTTLPFVIHDTLVATLSPVQCEGYISIDWAAIPNATGYEVMMLRGGEMVSVATVSAATLTYTIGGLSRDSTYWVSVRPFIAPGGSPGRRAIAVSRRPNTGTCAGSVSDNDIKLDSIYAPLRSGRQMTSTALTSTETVSVLIRNLDDNPTPGNITVGYILNNAPPVTETLVAPAIPGGGTLLHSFAGSINLSATGTYELKTFVVQAGDPVPQNDTLTKTFKQLDNPPITSITYPANLFKDDFDAAPEQSWNTRQTGLTGLDRYDFVNSSDLGRIRTFINTGIAYSGNRAITLDATVYNGGGTTDSLTGTYNLATFNAATDDIRLDFRYKNHGQLSHAANNVWIRGDDTKSWLQAYDLYANQNGVDGSFKKSSSIELSDLLSAGTQNFSSSFQVRWGQWGQIQAVDNDGGAGYSFDDVRIYKVTDDIQMVSIDTPVVNSCGLSAVTPIRISVRNSSNTAIPAVPGVPVRFRINGGAWTTENIPGIGANATVVYTFTSTANLSAPGNYLVETQVLYPTDTYADNDTLSTSVTNTPVITVTNSSPYLQDFESGSGYWYSGGRNNTWEYGTPASYKITRAASGSKAWKTRIAGDYNDMESSYLYSPCFDISTMTSPALSFSLALDMEDCGGFLCDGVYMEYSNDGKTWARLGANGQGTNWYNKAYTGNNLWSVKNYTRWHVATIPLSVIPIPVNQLTSLRFRFVVVSDMSVNRDGAGIDDFHIYSNPNGIYSVTGTSPVVNQPVVNGSGWIHFIEGGTNKLIASVNPNGTDLGSTDVQSYIWTGAVRVNSDQYYHNRNITIKPTTVNLPDSATVRFYFKDNETEALINATGCAYCTKPAMAYQLGVSKYSDADDSKENGTLADNTPGNYIFINSSKTRIVPFDSGYYAEFKVKNFSEFWLNGGGINGNTPLPLRLLSFTAKKQSDNNVLAEWVTADEYNVHHFEVELARGNTDYQFNSFGTIGQLPGLGNAGGEQRYSFTDRENNKTGVRYYRLKAVDNDGRITYSPIRPVLFSQDSPGQVYPNPSAGMFNYVFQADAGETVTVKIHDASGRTVAEYKQKATGFVQKINIDLRDARFAKGLYLAETAAGERREMFRLVKQ